MSTEQNFLIVDEWETHVEYSQNGRSRRLYEVPVMSEGSVPILGSDKWLLPNGKIIKPVTRLQCKHLTTGRTKMTQEETELLLISLLRLLAPEDRKRLQQNLDMLNYGSSCGDSSYDRKEARARMESIDRLKAIVETPVESML